MKKKRHNSNLMHKSIILIKYVKISSLVVRLYTFLTLLLLQKWGGLPVSHQLSVEKINGRVLTFGLPRDLNNRFEVKGPFKLGSLTVITSKWWILIGSLHDIWHKLFNHPMISGHLPCNLVPFTVLGPIHMYYCTAGFFGNNKVARSCHDNRGRWMRKAKKHNPRAVCKS